MILENNSEESSKNLKEFKKDLTNLIENIKNVKSKINLENTPFKVQNVIFQKQWEEFEGIQSRLGFLEKKESFEMAVFENLKQICLNLNLDEENLFVLKNGSFKNDTDLIKMEKSLNILTTFSNKKYDIKIIKESEIENSDVFIKFLKRFIIFLSKVFVESDARSELKVHSSFYNSIKKFRFIYKASRSNTEYYAVLCKAYLRKSIDLYNKEFDLHLSRISDLVNDNKGLEMAIETIIKSYICLYESEQDFMNFMEIDSDPKEIFSDVDSMIFDFIDSFYKRSSYCVLATISQFVTEETDPKLGSLGILLNKKCISLNEIFVHQHKSTNISFDLVELINLLKNKNLNVDLYLQLMKLIKEKAISSQMNQNLNESIKNLQIVLCLENFDEKFSKIIEIMKEKLTRKIIKFIFSSNEIKSDISNVFGYLDSSKKGFNEVKTFIKETILENCDDSNRTEAIRIISKF